MDSLNAQDRQRPTARSSRCPACGDRERPARDTADTRNRDNTPDRSDIRDMLNSRNALNSRNRRRAGSSGISAYAGGAAKGGGAVNAINTGHTGNAAYDANGGHGAGQRGAGQRGGGMKRLARQTALAALFFLLVSTLVGSDSLPGRAARSITAAAATPASSWIDWSGGGTGGGALSVGSDTVLINGGKDDAVDSVDHSVDSTAADSGTDADNGSTEGAESTGDISGDEGIPVFTAPASGIIVTELAVAASGFSTRLGVTISGAAGQQVRAAAAGEVAYIGSSDDGFIVELLHSGGFSSVYQGLSELAVGSGDILAAGDALGSTDSGRLTFSMLRDNSEVDPLLYLFGE